MKLWQSPGVLLACILVVIPSSLALFTLPSPWGYICDVGQGRCIKEEKTGINSYETLSRCKLTCDKYGVLWPKPTDTVDLSDDVVEFLPTNVTHTITAQLEVEALLEEAIVIFKKNLLYIYHPDYLKGKPSWEGSWKPNAIAHELHLDITVSGTDTRVTLDTDESYTLSVSVNGDQSTATIIAPSYFGARHALETLSQLIEHEESSNTLILISTAEIVDSPTFSYRGILLDTACNFFSIKAIERTLDAMSANKLNTFHWHITGSASFPLFLETLPNMSYYGAYSSHEVYYPADVKHVVEYGRVRGIRVLPELDAPAHVGNGFQWGEQQGLGKLAVCVNQEPWLSFCAEPPCGQLNIANLKMYDVLKQIYTELVELFSPIDLFHFGGDEVNLNCWNTTDEIVDWMTSSGFGLDEDAYYNQWSEFQIKARDRLITANKGKEVPGIIWTSHLTEAEHIEKYISKDKYIIQIWTTGDDPLIGELLDRNYRVIFSNYDSWYLDCGFGAWVGDGNNWCSPYKGWQTVYDNSPIAIATNLTTTFDPALILGGEAAMWSEQTDDNAVDSRLWPRGAALAERLWTNPSDNWRTAETRFVHHRQRMVKRGIQADRIQPQWCHQNEGLCYA